MMQLLVIYANVNIKKFFGNVMSLLHVFVQR